MKTHSNSPLFDHHVLLIKSISFTYMELKMNYSLKFYNKPLSLNTWYNKLTLYNVTGQNNKKTIIGSLKLKQIFRESHRDVVP